jgi:hypothetical protein
MPPCAKPGPAVRTVGLQLGTQVTYKAQRHREKKILLLLHEARMGRRRITEGDRGNPRNT